MVFSQTEKQLAQITNLDLQLKYFKALEKKRDDDVLIDLPQSPVQLSMNSRVLNAGNWGHNFLNLDFLKSKYYSKGFIPDRKIIFIVVDTMAYPSHSALIPYAVDKKYMFDFTMDRDGIDDHGHGHHCSGIIIGYSNQYNLGVSHVKGFDTIDVFMGQKGLSSEGLGTSDSLSESILKSMDICKSDFPDYTPVFSFSWASSQLSERIKNAIEQVVKEGAFVVGAVGNSGVRRIDYPAALRDVLAVGSVDKSGKKSSFSQYGPELFTAAPGRDIWSCYKNDGQYVSWTGTSMATPMFASMVGHVLKFNPQIKTQEDLVLHIDSKFKDAGVEGRDHFYGYGYPMADTLLDTVNIKPDDKEDPKEEEPEPDKPKTKKRRTFDLHPSGNWEFNYSYRDQKEASISKLDVTEVDKSNTIIISDIEIRTKTHLYFDDVYDWIENILSDLVDKLTVNVPPEYDSYDVMFWTGKYLSYKIKEDYSFRGNIKKIHARDQSGRKIIIEY